MLSLFSMLTLTACSASKPDPMDYLGKFKDTFSTEIKGNGIKLFVYKAKLATAPDRGFDTDLPHLGRMDMRRQDAYSYQREQQRLDDELELWEQQVLLGLEKTIEMTGYCKKGFIELSRFIEMERGEVRGECNEGATEQEIEKQLKQK